MMESESRVKVKRHECKRTELVKDLVMKMIENDESKDAWEKEEWKWMYVLFKDFMSSTFLSPPHKERCWEEEERIKKGESERRKRERMDSSPWIVIKWGKGCKLPGKSSSFFSLPLSLLNFFPSPISSFPSIPFPVPSFFFDTKTSRRESFEIFSTRGT